MTSSGGGGGSEGGGGGGGGGSGGGSGGSGGSRGFIALARKADPDVADAVHDKLDELEKAIASGLPPKSTVLGWRRDVLSDDHVKPEKIAEYIQGVQISGPHDSPAQTKAIQTIVTSALKDQLSTNSPGEHVQEVKILASHQKSTVLIDLKVLKVVQQDLIAYAYVVGFVQVDNDRERAAKVEKQLIDYGTKASPDPQAYKESVAKALQEIRSV